MCEGPDPASDNRPGSRKFSCLLEGVFSSLNVEIRNFVVFLGANRVETKLAFSFARNWFLVFKNFVSAKLYI